jgi:hypothetical protein
MRRPRLAFSSALAVLGVLASGCTSKHPGAINTTGAVLTGDKGKVMGRLVQVGGPPGASASAGMGEVQLLNSKGDLLQTVSRVSNWDFELEPGNYSLRGTLDGTACGPIAVKIASGTVVQNDLTCSIK